MKKYPDMSSIDTHEVNLGLSPKVKNTFVKTQKPLPSSKKKGYKSSSVRSSKTGGFVELQRCTVKISYRETKDQHEKNLKYIQKDGKSKDGDKPVLYGNVTEEEYKKHMGKKSWRLIVAPESNNIDLKVLAEELIKKIETMKGYELYWIAANHFDTDNHHAHILINGIDKKGREINLFKPKEFGSQLIRTYAREICTSMVGKRRQCDLNGNTENQVKKAFLTSIDKSIFVHLNENVLDANCDFAKNNLTVQKRLEFLQSIGLVHYDKKRISYVFVKGWTDNLKTLGKFNNFMEGFNIAGCAPDKYRLHDVRKSGPVKGKILHIFSMAENSNTFAVIVQESDGTFDYVPLPYYPSHYKKGDEVTIKAYYKGGNKVVGKKGKCFVCIFDEGRKKNKEKFFGKKNKNENLRQKEKELLHEDIKNVLSVNEENENEEKYFTSENEVGISSSPETINHVSLHSFDNSFDDMEEIPKEEEHRGYSRR